MLIKDLTPSSGDKFQQGRKSGMNDTRGEDWGRQRTVMWGDVESRRRRDMTARGKRARRGVWLDIDTTLLILFLVASLAAATSAYCRISNYKGWERLSAPFAEDETDCRYQLMWDADKAEEQANDWGNTKGKSGHMPLTGSCYPSKQNLWSFLIHFKDIWIKCFSLAKDERRLLVTETDAKSLFIHWSCSRSDRLTHKNKLIATTPPVGL